MFTKAEINAFYATHIVPYCRDPYLSVIRQVLCLLDAEGACPSVLKNNFSDKSAYRVLQHTTLLEHSLHVAEQMAELVEKRGFYYAVCIIAALGHDLGKLWRYAPGGYSRQPHGETSWILVKRMILDVNQKKKGAGEEVVNNLVILALEAAIRHHHRNCLRGDIWRLLRAADSRAREREYVIKPGMRALQGSDEL